MGDGDQDWGEGHMAGVGAGGSDCKVVCFWGVGVFLEMILNGGRGSGWRSFDE